MFLAILLWAAFTEPAQEESSYDVLIRGGQIVDGTGNPWFHGDIGIRGGRIATIGRLDEATAVRIIEAEGSWWPRDSSTSIRTPTTRCSSMGLLRAKSGKGSRWMSWRIHDGGASRRIDRAPRLPQRRRGRLDGLRGLLRTDRATGNIHERDLARLRLRRCDVS